MSDRPDPSLLTPPATPSLPSPPVVEHLLNRCSLLGRQMAQASQHGWSTAAMLPFSARTQTWQELFAMQQALLEQFQQLQQGWLHGWNSWFASFGQLKKANTMSKVLEQEFNLAGQCLLLLQGQATDLANLQENFEVNYGYWLGQQLDRRA